MCLLRTNDSVEVRKKSQRKGKAFVHLPPTVCERPRCQSLLKEAPLCAAASPREPCAEGAAWADVSLSSLSQDGREDASRGRLSASSDGVRRATMVPHF